MSKPSKIALFTVIGLLIMALLAYGFLTSRQLDAAKEENVDSNIDQYLYDEATDTLETDEELEDLYDGKEAEVEDDDFEVYEEPGGWEDISAEDPVQPIADVSIPETSVNLDNQESEEPTGGAPEELVSAEQPEPEVKKPEPAAITPEKKPVNVDFSDGSFVVVVGSYSSERNANKKLKALNDIGFGGSIRQLPGSRLQSVIAGSFPSISAAERQANKIEKKGIRAIVKELD